MVKASGISRTSQTGELDRRIAALTLPALGSIAAEPAYSLADTAIVGHLGRAPLDSLAIASTALNMTTWVAIFLTTATTSAVAGLAAGHATGRAGRIAGAAYLVAAVAGMVVALGRDRGGALSVPPTGSDHPDPPHPDGPDMTFYTRWDGGGTARVDVAVGPVGSVSWDGWEWCGPWGPNIFGD